MAVILRNGKNLADAIREFRQDKEPTSSKFGKYDYFRIEEYVELLDQCFGADGYGVSYSEGSSIQVSPTQVVFLVKATVSVYGEDGSVVYRFEGYGTHEPTREAEKDDRGKPISGTFSDRAINLETLGMVGCVNALKSACTQLGCFGMRNLTENTKPNAAARNGAPAVRGTAQGNQGNGQQRQQSQQYPEETLSFYVCNSAKESGTDKNGNTVYILPVHEIVDGRSIEKESEIIFYKNFYEDASRLAKIIHWDGIPKRFSMKVRKVDPQYKKNANAYNAFTFRGFCG